MLCSFLVVAVLPSRLRLRCIAWLSCVLVRFPKTVGCCPGEVRSQDCSGLVASGCYATSGLRYAIVVLDGAFWWVFPERRLGGSGGGSPRTSCVASAVCYVLSVSRLFGLRSGDVFPERLLALWSTWALSVKVWCLDHVPGRCVGQVVFLFIFRVSRLRWWDFMCPQGWKFGFVSHSLWALPDGSLEEADCVPSSSAFRGLFGVVVLAGQLVACFLTMATFVVKASFRCVFLLCLSCALEVLVAVGRVALPTCGGRSGALCLRAFKSQYGCCALEAVSGGESLSVGLESFQAVAPCAVSRVCSVLEAFSFPPLGHLVLADALWLYHYRCGVAALPCLGSLISGTPGFGRGLCSGFPSRFGERVCSVVVPCFGLGPFEVNMLSSTSAVVLFPV
ncbi:hypothetical protein Taro_050120 [Colocasia esculenta]|uniref:Secreted protein n=1 Tax=Colocasia esculenta TaxID=4460 RepID=A0A843XCX9_COLES|nr:hypothetical protein [Colocasia esculenta]